MSLKCPFGVLLVIAWLGGTAWAPAQDGNPAADVKKIQEQFEAELLNLNKPLAMLQDKYRGYLTKQKADFQAAGKLEEMLAVDAELQSLSSGSDEPLSNYPELKRLQEIYRTQRSTVQTNGVKNKLSIIQSFQKNAADLAAKLTKEGKIEEAKLALAEAKRFEAMSLDPALAVVPPKAEAPKTVEAKGAKEVTNSLGMKFVPVPGTDVLFCIHEVRWKDYAAYTEEYPNIVAEWKSQIHDGFVIPEKAGEHPVVRVSLDDANDFCAWLSKEEKREGRIYRLPTDHEWSMAVGIGTKEDSKASPVEKTGLITAEYPWGSEWPPSKGAGNLSDQTRKAKAPRSGAGYLDGYDDEFATTAPVMSFKANQLGLHDLGGNVWEWVADKYAPSSPVGVLRGGSWSDPSRASLLASFRLNFEPTGRSTSFGFRCVLVNAGTGGKAR